MVWNVHLPYYYCIFIQFAAGRFNSFADWPTQCDKCLKELRPLYGFNNMVNILTFPYSTRKAFLQQQQLKTIESESTEDRLLIYAKQHSARMCTQSQSLFYLFVSWWMRALPRKQMVSAFRFKQCVFNTCVYIKHVINLIVLVYIIFVRLLLFVLFFCFFLSSLFFCKLSHVSARFHICDICGFSLNRVYLLSNWSRTCFIQIECDCTQRKSTTEQN